MNIRKPVFKHISIIISAVIVFTVTGPMDSCRGLAIWSTSQTRTIDQETALTNTSLSVTEYILGDPDKGISPLPVKYLKPVMKAELGYAVSGVDLDDISVDNGVVSLTCLSRGERVLVRAALKGTGLEGDAWPLSDRYEVTRADYPDTYRAPLSEKIEILPLTKEYAVQHAQRLADIHNMIEGSNWIPEQLTAERWEKGQFRNDEEKIFYGKWNHSLAVVNSVGQPIALLIVYERPRHEYKSFSGNDTAIEGPVLYVHNIAVDPAYRGRGIGAALLRQAARKLRDEGFLVLKKEYDGPPIMTLQTNVMNINAQGVYERVGFRKVGLKHNDFVYAADTNEMLEQRAGRVSEPTRELGVKVAFFDWDGTISDTAVLTHDVFVSLFPVIMPGGTREEAELIYVERNLDGLMLDKQYDILMEIAEGKGVSLTIPKFDYVKRFEADKVALIGEKAEEVKGAIAFIRFLRSRGVAVHVVSGMARYELIKQVEKFGLINDVQGICGGPSTDAERKTFAKSKASYMKWVLKERGLSPDDAVMIGDTDQDRANAIKAGILFVGRAEDDAKAEYLSANGAWPTIRDYHDIPQVIETVRTSLYEKNVLDKGNAIASLIVLARKAQRENQRLIIGIETDWIPGTCDKGRLQRDAISPLIRAIEDIGRSLRDMGINNVSILHESADALAGAMLKEAEATVTSMKNMVAMASTDTINSEGFKVFRDADDNNRPFLAGINATELVKAYAEFGETTGKQLYIRLTEMLYIALELASGKDIPQLPAITFYDKQKRIVIFLPKAEPLEYELLREKYNADLGVLRAA